MFFVIIKPRKKDNMDTEMKSTIETMIKCEPLTDDEARLYIDEIFKGYAKRKKESTLYTKDDLIPQILICAYYLYVEKLNNTELYNNFKRKYIYNENQLEEVHEPKEKQGLSRVYDYLQSLDNFSNVNVYDIFKIHKILYSLVDCADFGGSLRISPAHISGAPINLTSPEDIPAQLQDLYLRSKTLATRGRELSQNLDLYELLKYVDDCIELKCNLVKIHPFADGNGRSARALLNLYFKIVGLPPVYVTKKEKKEYQEAMAKAICDKEYNPDFTSINRFYYYKICDSIIELDISKKMQNKRVK